jgi:hypothetical protein
MRHGFHDPTPQRRRHYVRRQTVTLDARLAPRPTGAVLHLLPF